MPFLPLVIIMHAFSTSRVCGRSSVIRKIPTSDTRVGWGVLVAEKIQIRGGGGGCGLSVGRTLSQPPQNPPRHTRSSPSPLQLRQYTNNGSSEGERNGVDAAPPQRGSNPQIRVACRTRGLVLQLKQALALAALARHRQPSIERRRHCSRQEPRENAWCVLAHRHAGPCA